VSGSFYSIAEAARLIAARRLSAVELTAMCLERIEKLDPLLHSFIVVAADSALEAAQVADAEIRESGPKGPLHGIPIALKDVFKTKGIATTAHSRLLQHYVPEQDSTCAQRLTAAGSIMLGKLSTHEFAMGGPSFDLPWPPARNPWNPAYYTSGSSSGTGAAVAAGLILGGMGSDTAGSIRAPSALCGIAGMKPTYGLVSRAGILPLAFSMDHAGPMAWSVEDCAIMLQVLAGFDPKDPASADRPIVDYRKHLSIGVKGVKIGVVRHFYEEDVQVSAEMKRGVEDAIAVYRGLGAEIRDVILPPLADWHACGFLILLTEAYAVHEAWFTTHFREYGELMREIVVLGAFISGADYLQALRRRRELCTAMADCMANVDILLTAGWQAEAPLVTDMAKWSGLETPLLTIPFNVTGYPALSVCTGFGANGLPVGMQLAARPFQEQLLFSIGHAYEQTTSWRQQRPPMCTALA